MTVPGKRREGLLAARASVLLAFRHVTEGASEGVRYSIKREEEESFRDEKFAYFFFFL